MLLSNFNSNRTRAIIRERSRDSRPPPRTTHLGDITGKRVLDLGCGRGWFTARLHERGADVVGVDGSERLLEVARQRYPDVEFEHSDLTEGFEGTFDIVVALMVLMDLPNLAPVRPRVTDGGVLIATILHPAFLQQLSMTNKVATEWSVATSMKRSGG